MRARDLAAGLAALGILAVLLSGLLNGVDPGILVRRALAAAALCGLAGGAVPEVEVRSAAESFRAAAAAIASKAADSGALTNTPKSPWLIASARRICCSANGPRIRPITVGATGKS